MRGGRVGDDRVRGPVSPFDTPAHETNRLRQVERELAFARAQLATVAEIAHEALDGWESLAPIANDETEMARIAELRASLPPPRESAEPPETA